MGVRTRLAAQPSVAVAEKWRVPDGRQRRLVLLFVLIFRVQRPLVRRNLASTRRAGRPRELQAQGQARVAARRPLPAPLPFAATRACREGVLIRPAMFSDSGGRVCFWGRGAAQGQAGCPRLLFSF